ncbi:MAG: ATP-dependent DNA helicase RecG [Thermomicrobiales bacterium]
MSDRSFRQRPSPAPSTASSARPGTEANAARVAERRFSTMLQALRHAWRGGPELRSDVNLAIRMLRTLQTEVATTHHVAGTIAACIEELEHLPEDGAARRFAIESIATRMKAIQPVFGTPDEEANLGKLNSALGEKRAGRPAPPPRPSTASHTVRRLPPDAAITELPKIGPKVAEKLEKLNIATIEDALHFQPRRHIDYSRTQEIGAPQLLQGDVTLRGEIVEMRVQHSPNGRGRVTARISDGTGTLRITWFNTFISKQLVEGDEIYVSGQIEGGYGGLQMTSPEWEMVGGAGTSTGRLIPVYPSTQGLAQKTLRSMTRNALDATKTELTDWLAEARPYLPAATWDRLPPLADALENLHYPPSQEDYERARMRLSFENLLLLQLGLVKRKGEQLAQPGRAFTLRQDALDAFRQVLPFSLTGAQERSTAEILRDLQRPHPMTRLLQGDVGSGKTVVAAMAAVVARGSGYQTAIMAPTEILAGQHDRNLTALFAPLPEGERPRVALLTGSTKAAERRALGAALEAGEIDILFGTHALIQDYVTFQNLGLVVIDEQHRFGVRQRGALTEKANGFQPHVLSMTATPIPRTLNLVLNGDLDVSVLDERPPGRIPIETRRYLGSARVDAYRLVREEIEKGHQAFVICPLVEESEAVEAKAAVEEAERLQTEVFPQFRVAVLHGRMSAKQKDEVMAAFRNREFDILVSTSVVEVGIDIPNATVMMIEGADRFGLSQLHQFRGRVGRSGAKSYCLLLADEVSMDGNLRLETMVATDNGFVLAERDLELRGPGDFIGTRQSGLPELGWLDQGFDTRLLAIARETAEKIVAANRALDHEHFPLLGRKVRQFWSTASVVDAGKS